MKILDRLIGRVTKPSRDRTEPSMHRQHAATELAPVPMPDPVSKQVTVPSFKTQIARSTSPLQRADRGLANTDVVQYRFGSDTRTILRDLAASNPDLGGTINAYLRTGIPKMYRIKARNPDGTFNEEATRTAYNMLRRLTMLGDPSLGYNATTDIQSLSESLGFELVLYGACMAELVLGDLQVGVYIQPVSITKIQFREEQNGVYPIQVVAGNEIKLDLPTIFYVSIDQDLLDVYAKSPMEKAVQAILADAQFMNDMRRAMKKAIQPRLTATIDEEKLISSAPIDIRNDPEKLGKWTEEILSQVTAQLTDLDSDQALVGFDSVTYEIISPGNGSSGAAETMQIVQTMIDRKSSAGMNSNQTVLGRESQASAANVSSMLFVKNVDVLPRKLSVLYSRILTQGIRMMGEDVTVQFEYDEIDLRPALELEAYKAMRQSRIKEQLSLGFITFAEACIDLYGDLPPPGYKELSGTMFMAGNSQQVANPESQTSTMNQGGAPDNLKPATPANKKS